MITPLISNWAPLYVNKQKPSHRTCSCGQFAFDNIQQPLSDILFQPLWHHFYWDQVFEDVAIRFLPKKSIQNMLNHYPLEIKTFIPKDSHMVLFIWRRERGRMPWSPNLQSTEYSKAHLFLFMWYMHLLPFSTFYWWHW